MRFPGFTDEWKTRKLGEVAIVSSGGTPNRSTSSYWNGNIPWVSTSLIDFNFIEKVDEYITEEGLTNSSAKLFPKGTLLIAMYGQGKTRGKVAILNIEATTNQACGAITTNNDVLNPLFAFQNLTKRYDEIRDLSNQGGQENLSAGIIKGIKINFPEVQEQQKIVSFIDLIDERISTQNKIIEQLETLIKSVSQKIFTQKIRFKELSDEWKLVSLGEVGEIITGKTPSTKDLDLWSGNIQFVTPTDIKENKYQHSTERTIKKTDKLKILPPKSIMFTCIASIGKMSLSLYPSVTNQQINSIIPHSYFSNEFIFYAVKNIAEIIKSTQSTSTMPIINKTEFSKFKISIPSLKEQNHIAFFLSKIDQKIETEKLVLQQLEKQKNYLLQQMFI
ncbi:restriction endonuclease subunit S [Empedobacter sp. UBA7620]|uniref:restriction endonuclease subunit S n=1 Tax=Empedobacter sp. UBA7620 TaxID=1946452 RepID=UPI0025C4237C|nr:restriction endonuclease subunit S [Empedobacter sp. UBA7620]